MKVAFIGLGNMGRGMAGCILKAGFELAVFNRTRSKMNSFVTAGAKGGSSIGDTVKDADIVITSLMDDKSVLDTLGAGLLAAMKPGAIHLGVTTISPNCADELAKLHKEHGTTYVAGPVAGRPNAAADGELLTFLAGDHAAIEYVMPVCKAYAKEIVEISERHGVANSMKLCLNYSVISIIELMGEVYTFAERSGVPLDAVRDFYLSAFAAPPLKMYARKIVTRNFDGEMGFAMTAGLKDVSLIADAHERAGVPFEIGKIIKTKLEAGIASGMSARDWSAIYDVTRHKAGLP